ncbi:MAG: PQQ-dependent sugar dehydrogenase [Deltaproteobacteria bacterium]|nr:PQQ-dependent sugar dehydrogenase [Deltaproteobacteria bacterium]
MSRLAVRFAAVPILGGLLLSCRHGSDGNDVPPPGGFPSLALTRVASGLAEPVHITHAGDGSGRLFVVEKRGTIRIVRDRAVLPTPFLDLSGAVRSTGSEQGLLSVAFPPDFATRRHFYVDYTGQSGVGDTVVARHTLSADPDVANAAGEAVLRVRQPFTNHNGGQLAFGPDGFLYVGLGDGGGGGDPFGNGQNLSSLLGKILRLDVEAGVPTYAIPTGNPFGDEVWAYGLRNPWRFSFDRATGDLFIADVGQAQFEEIDVQPATSRGGENYGWNVMEGFHCFGAATCNQAGLTLPVVEYTHAGGNCSVTGGFVYRGGRLPALQGIYLYGDYCSGRIWGLRRNGAAWENGLLLTTALQISSFGEDEAGNLYVADLGAGDIYRIDFP